jgi:hypothetical protein
MKVAKKVRPQIIEASLIRFLSTRIRLEYSGDENSNSDVTRRIMVANASQEPMSDNVNGKFICSQLNCFERCSSGFSIRGDFEFL